MNRITIWNNGVKQVHLSVENEISVKLYGRDFTRGVAFQKGSYNPAILVPPGPRDEMWGIIKATRIDTNMVQLDIVEQTTRNRSMRCYNLKTPYIFRVQEWFFD